MAKQTPVTKEAYGSVLDFPAFRANHKIRSRYMAGVLSILFGMLGAGYFYIGKFLSGLLELLFTLVFFLFTCVLFKVQYLMLIPFALGALIGIYFLAVTDEKFRIKFKRRTF